MILKVNDLEASIAFYTGVLGFIAEGTDGPFTVLRVGPDFLIQMAPWGTPGFQHYALMADDLRVIATYKR
jgi:catechol 2,3-dioxygenase-like lactoylglutathione lyase family enzyme